MDVLSISDYKIFFNNMTITEIRIQINKNRNAIE